MTNDIWTAVENSGINLRVVIWLQLITRVTLKNWLMFYPSGLEALDFNWALEAWWEVSAAECSFCGGEIELEGGLNNTGLWVLEITGYDNLNLKDLKTVSIVKVLKTGL